MLSVKSEEIVSCNFSASFKINLVTFGALYVLE